MKSVRLGRTDLVCSRIGLELSPIRKLSFAASRDIITQAVEAGVNFFDLGLPDRETAKRIGYAIAGMRDKLVLAGSFVPDTVASLENDLKWMLRDLKTDHLDILQIHDPDFVLRPGEATGIFDALLDAKKAGYIHHIGITTGDAAMAMNLLEYGWYDTLQYPWNHESDEAELMILSCCPEAEVGAINVPFEIPVEEAAKEEVFLRNYENDLMLWMLDEKAIEHIRTLE